MSNLVCMGLLPSLRCGRRRRRFASAVIALALCLLVPSTGTVNGQGYQAAGDVTAHQGNRLPLAEGAARQTGAMLITVLPFELSRLHPEAFADWDTGKPPTK